MESGAPPSPTKPHISALPPGQAARLPAPQGPRSDIMGECVLGAVQMGIPCTLPPLGCCPLLAAAGPWAVGQRGSCCTPTRSLPPSCSSRSLLHRAVL